MVNLSYTVGLMAIFCVKHFVADYLLQGKYMLGKFKETGWIAPLAAHCAVHAAFTAAIAVGVLWHRPGFMGLLLPFILFYFDFTVHFIMDRIKASPYMMGRWKNFSAKEYAWIQRGYYPPEVEGLTGSTTATAWRHSPEGLKLVLRNNTYFWWALGFDQMVHGLTDVAIIYMLLRY